MKYCHIFVPTDLSEVKLERNSQKQSKLRYDTGQFIKIDTLSYLILHLFLLLFFKFCFTEVYWYK